MPEHTIRPAVPADSRAIRSVLVAAFPTDAEARLVELLTARGKATISLVAEINGTIVGHILFSPATWEGEAPAEPRLSGSFAFPTGLGLAPVAVHPDFQNQGIGSALVRAGLDQCRRLANEGPLCRGGPQPPTEAVPVHPDPARQARPTWVVLLGHETYYPRFGFAPASRWNLTGDYGESDAFQFLPLTAAANEIRGGHIHYAPEFGKVFAT